MVCVEGWESMTATLAVRINISLLRITFSLVKFFVSSLRSRPVLSTVDAFGIVTPLGRVNKRGPGNFAFKFSGLAGWASQVDRCARCALSGYLMWILNGQVRGKGGRLCSDGYTSLFRDCRRCPWFCGGGGTRLCLRRNRGESADVCGMPRPERRTDRPKNHSNYRGSAAELPCQA